MLVDHPDAQPHRVERGVDRDLLPADRDRPRIGVVDAREHVHQGGFARAVLPEQGEDLAVPDVQVDLVVCDNASKPFGDLPAFDCIFRSCGHNTSQNFCLYLFCFPVSSTPGNPCVLPSVRGTCPGGDSSRDAPSCRFVGSKIPPPAGRGKRLRLFKGGRNFWFCPFEKRTGVLKLVFLKKGGLPNEAALFIDSYFTVTFLKYQLMPPVMVASSSFSPSAQTTLPWLSSIGPVNTSHSPLMIFC